MEEGWHQAHTFCLHPAIMNEGEPIRLWSGKLVHLRVFLTGARDGHWDKNGARIGALLLEKNFQCGRVGFGVAADQLSQRAFKGNSLSSIAFDEGLILGKDCLQQLCW